MGYIWITLSLYCHHYSQKLKKMLNPTKVQLPKYLPLFDPDSFQEASFYKEIEKIGYKQILLGGTGNATMKKAIEDIHLHTNLSVAIVPSGPGDIFPTELVFLVAIMNSNSHYFRPFGSGSVACGVAITQQGIPFIPVAYFVMGDSTARWHTDADLIPNNKILLSYCQHTQMLGYKWLLLDYEGHSSSISVELIQKIKKYTQINLMIINEFTPETALQAINAGVDTAITASDIYEETHNPIQLAREFYENFTAVETNNTLVTFI